MVLQNDLQFPISLIARVFPSGLGCMDMLELILNEQVENAWIVFEMCRWRIE